MPHGNRKSIDPAAGGQKSIKILHLEDDRSNASLIRETLLQGGLEFDITLVDSRTDFRSNIEEGKFDVILADFHLPSFDGNEALQIAREFVPHVPFIFVSGTMGEDTAVESVLGGATDYVLKNNLSRLVPSVRRALNEAAEKRELKLAEEKSAVVTRKLRESEEKYRRLVDGLRDVVFSLAKDGTISSLNPAFERITGWQVSDWVGKSFTDLLHPDDRKGAKVTFRDVAEGKGTGINEYRVSKRSGDYLFAEISTTRAMDRDSLVGFLGVARDITDQRNLREQSLQSQRLESLGTLAAGIAHDFNNILAIILNYADSIRAGVADQHQLTEQVDSIVSAVNRGAALVRQIQAFSRSSQKNLTVVSINRLLKELSVMLKETFPSNMRVELELTDREPLLNVDREELYQSLLNVCVNARDAIISRDKEAMTTQGEITIRTGIVDAGAIKGKFTGPFSEVYAAVSVSDNGEGMGKETIRRAFEPFFTTKENDLGSGLGLAFVYGTVKGSSGFVDVQSEQGKGTTVTLYFPLDPVPSASNERSAESKLSNVRGKGELVLLVEDEKLLMNILNLSMREAGYNTLMAEDGAKALELYESRKDDISLVVSDNGLPVMDGISLFRRLNEIDPSVKMILTSGYMEQGLKDELMRAGLKDFIPKPYMAESVVNSAKLILGSEGASR